MGEKTIESLTLLKNNLLGLFKKNIFGQRIWVKKFIIRFFGALIYGRFNWRYKTDIKGAELFQNLPDKNVLIISNHQTYFADVSFMYHVIFASLAGSPNSVRKPGFFRPRKSNIYYVAAGETMKSGLLPKLLSLSGAIQVTRTWRSDGKNVRRKVNKQETERIDLALEDGWVITFPQGTTTAYAVGRVGTAIIAKNHESLVIPVVIDGFRGSFDKKGLRIKKSKRTLKLRVKEPMEIDYSKDVEEILAQMMDAIEQSEEHDFIGAIKKDPPKNDSVGGSN